MKIIADGGSTKIDWLLHYNDSERHITTPGINPSLLDEASILAALSSVMHSHPEMLAATEVEFYGAGCTKVASPKMQQCLQQVFVNASIVIVDSDIIGAARALCGDSEGIACILGTGANSCLWGRVADSPYHGMGIVRQTPALGYVLGDEGSGAVLGKFFLNAMYKGVLPASIKADFEQQTGLDMFGVIEHVYRQPNANRWLASLSPFIHAHIAVPEVEQLVLDNLTMFLRRNILPYNRPDLPVSFVGSIAHYYAPQLRQAAASLSITIGKIKKSPFS